MKRIRINKNDKLRVILSDVLPYEVPVLFSNDGFYRYLVNKKKDEFYSPFVKHILEDNKSFTIPFDYKIKKSTSSNRTLSIIHPASQIPFIDFYEKYGPLIISLCSKSPFSLRTPTKIASHYYDRYVSRETKIDDTSVMAEQADNEDYAKCANTYFSYKNYDFLYKFYDSYHFHRLEKKFKYLLTFDISKCFHNIYTHSISWAVKSKRFSKDNIKSLSFEKSFDELLQRANYQETNGIVIGPEASRIFAEIILQEIDLKVHDRLSEKNYIAKVDYSVRRYVDDYFVFSNDENLLSKVLQEFTEELERYKLYLNDSKTIRHDIPFMTGVTLAKVELGKFVNEVFNSCQYNLSEISDGQFFIKEIKSPSAKSNNVIRDIKCIIKSNNVSYVSVTGKLLSAFRTRILRILNNKGLEELSQDDSQKFSNCMYFVLDVLFFIYSMDTRVRTTYLMSQIIISIVNKVKSKNDELKENIKKKIYDESVFLIKSVSRSEENSGIEMLNLLVALKSLGDDYLLEQRNLVSIFGIRVDQSIFDIESIKKLNYFQIIILLFYIGEEPRYSVLKSKLEDAASLKITQAENPFQKAELSCLFFDYISCPYIPVDKKRDLVDIVYVKEKGKALVTSKINEIINSIQKHYWFMNWDQDVDLEMLLLNKELKSPY